MANPQGVTGPKPSELPPQTSTEGLSDEVRAVLENMGQLTIPTPGTGTPSEAGPGLAPEVRQIISGMTSGEEIDSAIQEGRGFLEDIQDRFGAGEEEFLPISESPLGFFKKLAVRARVGLGRNKAERLSLAKEGLENRGYEVKTKGSKILFRKDGSGEQFFELDPDGIDSIAEAISDLMLDFSGEIVETIPAVGTEIVGAGVGAAAGAAIGGITAGPPGLLAGGAAGGTTGLVAGAALGGAAGATARASAIRIFGGETSEDLGDEQFTAAAWNVAGLGFGAILKRVAGGTVRLISEALQSTPKARIRQAARVRQSVEELATQLGGKGRSDRATGQVVRGAVENAERQIGPVIDQVKNTAIKVSESNLGNPRQALPATDNVVTELLDQAGIVFDLDGRASLIEGKTLKEFAGFGGGPVAKKFLGELLTLNNKIVEGGLPIRELLENMDSFANLARFDKVVGTKVTGLSKRVRRALAEDRNPALQSLLKGTKYEKTFRDNFAEYSSKIDAIKDFKKSIFKKSPEKFIDMFIEPKNSDRVLDIKRILGSESQEWRQLSGEWFNARVKASLDPITGAVNGNKLKKDLARFGDDVVNEILLPAERMRLNQLAKIADEIPLLDIIDIGAETRLKDLAVLTVGKTLFPQTKIARLMRLFGSNARAAKWLRDTGLPQIAKNHPTPEGKRFWVRVTTGFGQLIDATKIQKLKSGRERLVRSAEVFTLNAERQAAGDVIEQSKDTLFGPDEDSRE